MRERILAACLLLIGCTSTDEDAGLCDTEHFVDSANVSGSQIARVGDRVAWTESGPTGVLFKAVDGTSGMTSAQAGIYAFGRGMAVDGEVVYWTAVLDGIKDSALYSTPASGVSVRIATFTGCTDPVGVAIAGGRWSVGFRDCGGQAMVRMGMGMAEIAAVPVDKINDLLPGFVLTDSTIRGFDPPIELPLPILHARRFARYGDIFYVTGTDQLNAVPLDGTAPKRLFNFLPGVTDVLVDDDAVYVVNSTDNDPGLFRLPITGGEPEQIAAHLGKTLAFTQDPTHVYWVTRDRQQQRGVWRAKKCK